MKYALNSAAFLLATLIGGTAAVQAGDVTVVGFGGSLQNAMRATMFDTWDGGSLAEESYTGGIAKIKSMVEAGSTVWDVVQMDENELMLACDEGLLELFDWQSLDWGEKIDAGAKQECGVGAFVFSMVPAYRGDATGAVTSWADFWDLERLPGKRGLRKQPRMTMEIALLADGVAPAELYGILATKAGQDRAFAKLDAIKSEILWWESGAQPMEWLVAGDLAMTAAYNGRVMAARSEGQDLRMVWDGQLYASDYWAVPRGGKTDAAFDLVRHMVSAEPQKAFAETMYYGVTNQEATAMISADVAAVLPTSPDNLKSALALSSAFWVDHEEDLQQRFNAWVVQ